MGKYLGMLSADAFTASVAEMKVGHYNIPAAKVVAADADGILKTEALGTAAKTVTTFLAQPPCAMTLTCVCSATQTGKATIYGHDIGGNEITEEVTLNSATPVLTVKAFADVTKVVLPIKAGTETITIGWGTGFGLPYKLSFATQVIIKLFNGAADSGTVTANATDLAKNVLALNGTADGTKAIDLFMVV